MSDINKTISVSNSDINTEEHFVQPGSDLLLRCEEAKSLEDHQVVVWKWRKFINDNFRILAVGKMLVRNDGKGKTSK